MNSFDHKLDATVLVAVCFYCPLLFLAFGISKMSEITLLAYPSSVLVVFCIIFFRAASSSLPACCFHFFILFLAASHIILFVAPTSAWDALHFWLVTATQLADGSYQCAKSPAALFWCDKHGLLAPAVFSAAALSLSFLPSGWGGGCLLAVLIYAALSEAGSIFRKHGALELSYLGAVFLITIPLLHNFVFLYGYPEPLLFVVTLLVGSHVLNSFYYYDSAYLWGVIILLPALLLLKNTALFVVLILIAQIAGMLWAKRCSRGASPRLNDQGLISRKTQLLTGLAIFVISFIFLANFNFSRALHRAEFNIQLQKVWLAIDSLATSVLNNASFSTAFTAVLLASGYFIIKCAVDFRSINKLSPEQLISGACMVAGFIALLSVPLCYMVIRPYFLTHALPGNDTSLSRVLLVGFAAVIPSFLVFVLNMGPQNNENPDG